MQNKKFKEAEIIDLVKKGQSIITSLFENKDICHEKAIFHDKGSRFYTSGSPSHLPSTKSLGRFLGISQQADANHTSNRQARLESVIAVSWAIAYAPFAKGQGFV